MIDDYRDELLRQVREHEDKVLKEEVLKHSDWVGDHKAKYIKATNIITHYCKPTKENEVGFETYTSVGIYETKPRFVEDYTRLSDERFRLLVKYAKDERSLTNEERQELFRQE